ncbi:hypothetical protein [Paenibacillus sp. 1P03SA]|uniref:hypothetical protein n=1 Tax=Paenibacillus sp. 1P03SA TaxID=3132294 RepID=UPI0039A0C69B
MRFEKMAVRRMKNWFQKNSFFRTGKGAINHIVEHDSRRVYFKSESSGMINTIELYKLKAAIRELFTRRTITRKQLESFSKFSSALLGLMTTILRGMAKLTKGMKGFRLTLIGVRFFFSGCDKAVRDLEVAKANGAEFVLMSYWWLKGKKDPFKHVNRLGLKVMLDSGAFTAHNKGATISVVEYAAFLIAHKDELHSYITLDVIGDDAATASNYAYLRGLDLSPVPVFPAMGDLANLARLIEEDHEFVAIGATVGMSERAKSDLFAKIFTAFPDGRFHWLGGSSSLITDFDWFSADSSTWLSGRKYGKLLDTEFRTTKAPASLSGYAALAHNVQILSALENKHIESVENADEGTRRPLLSA